jgi:hypothetical protein
MQKHQQIAAEAWRLESVFTQGDGDAKHSERRVVHWSLLGDSAARR